MVSAGTPPPAPAARYGALRAELRERLPEHDFRRLYGTTSLERIARQNGVGRHLVAALAAEYGIVRRTPAQRPLRPIDGAWLFDQYVIAGRTIREIAADLGMSEGGLYQRARALGIRIRRKGGPSHVKRSPGGAETLLRSASESLQSLWTKNRELS
ncbi:hypothetical protein OG592_35240 [Streptomyces avidinii]|uniref:hypothetical protein n=1 Tax=Streptomyces avidinii TaxID=1895 RepID=UPI00386B3821|nr:hypothetical protein OG592_35240 [Streptomyces avidinii]